MKSFRASLISVILSISIFHALLSKVNRQCGVIMFFFFSSFDSFSFVSVLPKVRLMPKWAFLLRVHSEILRQRNQDQSKCNEWRSFRFRCSAPLQCVRVLCASFLFSFILNASLSATNRCNNNKTYISTTTTTSIYTTKSKNKKIERNERGEYAGRRRWNEMSFRLRGEKIEKKN